MTDDDVNGLKALRQAAGLTQARLAAKIDCSIATIANTERGYKPSRAMVERIARVLDCEPGDLFEREGKR